jgi:hypothetical protein
MASTKRIYSLQTRQKAAQAYNDWKQTGKAVVKGREVSTVKEITKLFDLKNESTLRSWASKDWAKDALKKRLSLRGKKSKLSKEQKEKIKRLLVY